MNRPQKTHRLKTISPYFDECWKYNKPFEYRKDDRDFRVGDIVELFHYDLDKPEAVSGTKEIHGVISYILRNFNGLDKDHCVFAYKETNRIDPDKPEVEP